MTGKLKFSRSTSPQKHLIRPNPVHRLTRTPPRLEEGHPLAFRAQSPNKASPTADATHCRRQRDTTSTKITEEKARSKVNRVTEQTPWERSSEWFGRTIAIVLVMIAPGFAGNFLDQKFGTQLFMPLGFATGVILGISVLVILGNKLTPRAQGTALPWPKPDEDDAEEETRDAANPASKDNEQA